jgi:hypothetical protein
MVELLAFWILCSIVVGVIANSRGRGTLTWFFVSVLISPLLALILVLVMGRPPGSPDPANPEAPREETHVRCPACRELVRKDARKCKHCGEALVPEVDAGAQGAAGAGPQ